MDSCSLAGIGSGVISASSMVAVGNVSSSSGCWSAPKVVTSVCREGLVVTEGRGALRVVLCFELLDGRCNPPLFDCISPAETDERVGVGIREPGVVDGRECLISSGISMRLRLVLDSVAKTPPEGVVTAACCCC